MKPKVVFMGSPEFSVPTLKVLAAQYPVVGVVTQPDRAAGRGRTLTPPPVKEVAITLGLPVIQPDRLRQPEAMAQLSSWKPDLIVVAAFGQILRDEVLELPTFGCINVHASLLPRWRGAAPIQAAILHGDKMSGITIMCMDAGVDTGPLLALRETPILPEDTAASLSGRLADLGARLLIDTLPGFLRGGVKPQMQDNSKATYAPMLKKEDGELDFSKPAVYLERQVRAYAPWPGTFIQWDGQVLKILHARVISGSFEAGQRAICQDYPVIGAGQDGLLLEDVQPAGKKPMSGKAFLTGARKWA